MTTTTATTPDRAAESTTQVLLRAHGVAKSYGNVHALTDGRLRVRAGRVTAVIGDNGAGKSTFIGALSGVHRRSGGTIELDDAVVDFASPDAARDAGIETVYQDLALVDTLRVWQNLFLGRELRAGRGWFGWLKRREMRTAAREMVSELAVNVPSVDARVVGLSGGQRQAIALSRASGWGSKVVLLDEPTAALGVQETAKVEQMVTDLRGRGLGIVLISHNFDQVMRLSDDVFVMRAGRTVAHRDVADTDAQELVGLVTGAVTDDSLDRLDTAGAGTTGAGR